MRVFVLMLVVAVLVGFATGGRLDRIPEAGIRWTLLVPVALVMQPIPLPREWALTMLYASFALLVVFAVRNVRLPGFPLILLGALLNLTVIAVNAGMPVSAHAITVAGLRNDYQELLRDGEGAKHQLAGPGTRLNPLADVIGFPRPVMQVVSPGDLCIYSGAAWLIVAAMRGRSARRRQEDQPTGPDRHREATVGE